MGFRAPKVALFLLFVGAPRPFDSLLGTRLQRKGPRKFLGPCVSPGAGGGGRTLTALRPRDFESRASASSTTPARKGDQRLPAFIHAGGGKSKPALERPS